MASPAYKNKLRSGYVFGFAHGKKDDYLVDITRPDGSKDYLLDAAFLAMSRDVANIVGEENFWEAFINVFYYIGTAPEEDFKVVLAWLMERKYAHLVPDLLDYLLNYAYGAMIAERNWKFEDGSPSIVEHRMKCLAVHLVIFEKLDPVDVANDFNNMPADIIIELCKMRGITLHGVEVNKNNKRRHDNLQ